LPDSNFLGLRIKDPVWYLVIYPINFALIFGFFTLLNNNSAFEFIKVNVTSELIAVLSIVIAGIITLLLRSESKK